MITLNHECFDDLRRIEQEISEHEESIRQLKTEAAQIPARLQERTDIDWREAFGVLFLNNTIVRPSAIKTVLGLRLNADPREVFGCLGYELVSTCTVCHQNYTVERVSREYIIRGGQRICPTCERERINDALAKVEESHAARKEQDKQKVAALRSMPYVQYLQSEHWKETRAKALGRAHYKCQLCNSQHNLQVHHKTYVNRGCEQPDDLIVLCRVCHAKHHDKIQVSIDTGQVQL